MERSTSSVFVRDHHAAELSAPEQDIKLRVLAGETELQLVQTEAFQPQTPISQDERGVDQPHNNYMASPPRAQKLFIDATLMLRYGFRSAVGIVRVEHYVAEYLARDPDVELRFVVYDGNHSVYRIVAPPERELLEQILFHRYRLSANFSQKTSTFEKDPDTSSTTTERAFAAVQTGVAS